MPCLREPQAAAADGLNIFNLRIEVLITQRAAAHGLGG